MALRIETADDLGEKTCMTCAKRQARCVLYVEWKREEVKRPQGLSFGPLSNLIVESTEYVRLPVCMTCLVGLETEIREKL